jgi:hypothetical protein
LDTIAYIAIGKPYGCVGIDQAESLAYEFFEEFHNRCVELETRLEAYYREVERYNREVSGKTYIIGSAEERRISAWEAKLEEEEKEIDRLLNEVGDTSYEDIGIVEDVYLHW